MYWSFTIPRRARARGQKASQLRAPPLVWSGILVTVLAGGALIGALFYAERAATTSRTAEAFRSRLALLRIEREVTLGADRLDTLALLHLVSGGHAAELAAAEEAFERGLEQADQAIERFLSEPHQHHSQGAVALRTALSAFREAGYPIGTAEQDLRATDRFYEALGWISMPSPEGPWFALCDFVYDIQIAASYPLYTSSEYTARYWDVVRPPGAPTDEPGLESRAAYLRSIDHVSGDATETKWSMDRVLDRTKAERHGLGLPAIVDELLEAPGALTVRETVPFLLARSDEPTLSPAVMFERMSDYTERARNGADRALIRADGHIAAEAERADLRALAARAVALLAILLFAGVLVVVEQRRRRFSRRLRELAETDSLTDVGNRYSLRLYESERLADPEQGGFALMHVDLDNFKAINDSFGHQVGDQALVAFAALTRQIVPERNTVARIGGDEFVIVLHGLGSPLDEAQATAQELHRALSSPLDCGGRRLRVQASVGIATGTGEATLEDLMVEADLALYAAKERGPNQVEIFGDLVRRTLIQELPTILRDRELDCAFQPQIDLDTGAVVGVEALARWPGPASDQVPARKIIEVIEWLGETSALLASMMERVREAHTAAGDLFDGRFWLNLSPADLAVSGATETLLALLDSTSVPLSRLGIEVTESLPIVDFDLAVEMLSRLRQAGVAVAIDDFGSGNTPLKHLTTLPLDLVKLDRSVTADVDLDRSNRVLAEAVRFICDSHGIGLLCEGVENHDEVEALRRIGVRRIQGYAVARPMPLSRLVGYLGETVGESRACSS